MRTLTTDAYVGLNIFINKILSCKTYVYILTDNIHGKIQNLTNYYHGVKLTLQGMYIFTHYKLIDHFKKE